MIFLGVKLHLNAGILLSPAVALLWVAAIIDPIGKFLGLRFPALAFALGGVLLLGLPTILGRPSFRPGWREAAIFCTLIWLPVHGLMMYAWRGAGAGATFTDTSYIAAGVLLITSWLFTDRDSAFRGVLIAISCLRLFSVIVIAAYLAVASNDDSQWIALLSQGDVARFGFREYGGVTLPYIYFLASPMLVLLVTYEAQKLRNDPSVQRLILCSLAVFALGLSGTRAHLLIAALYVPVYLLVAGNSKYKGIIIVFGGGFLIAALMASAASILGDFFDTGETNNSMKLSALSQYIEIFSRADVLLVGQGFNAHEWSVPLQNMIAVELEATKTELTYLELIRVFGLLGSAPYFALLVSILRNSARMPAQFAWLLPGFALTLINSSLNPYLFSTNGILPMALVLGVLANYRRPSPDTHDRSPAVPSERSPRRLSLAPWRSPS